MDLHAGDGIIRRRVLAFAAAALAGDGDGTGATDSANIAAAISGAAPGDTIAFAPGTYVINAPVVYRSNMQYTGAGAALGNGTVIQQAGGANLTNAAGLSGLFVAHAWATDATACDQPVVISNLAFDGNRANNPGSSACGIVMVNYWSHIIGCYIRNTSRHGILLTDTTENGTNVVTNSCSENRVLRCKIVGPGGDGIHQVCANHYSNQDGFCVDNLIGVPGGSGINFQRGSGWVFRRNHVTPSQMHGIYLDNCFGCVLVENEVEPFGNAAASGAYYAGIRVAQLNGRGTVICGNYVGCDEPAGPAGFRYLWVKAAAAEVDAQVIAADNLIRCERGGTPTAAGTAMTFTADSGSTLHLRQHGNAIDRVLNPSYFGAQVVTYASDCYGHEHAVIGGAPAAFQGPASGTGAPVPAVSGNDFEGTFSFGAGSGPTAGSVGGVTFQTAFGATPAVTLTPGDGAVAALGLYVSGGPGSFDVNVSNAPAASQPAGTYTVHYSVSG